MSFKIFLSSNNNYFIVFVVLFCLKLICINDYPLAEKIMFLVCDKGVNYLSKAIISRRYFL